MRLSMIDRMLAVLEDSRWREARRARWNAAQMDADHTLAPVAAWLDAQRVVVWPRELGGG